jgi:hypothetical protein
MSRPMISASKGQYFVGGGGDPSEPDPSVLPGLLIGMGRNGFAVLTGVAEGVLPVEVQPLEEPPGSVDEGWDAVGETTVESREGSIRVAGWSFPIDEESTELAAGGPGLYRVRIHVRDRGVADTGESSEHHLLQAWRVREAAPPALLRGLDRFGRLYTGEDQQPQAKLDETNRAVASAVEVLLHMVDTGVRPTLSGQAVTLFHHGVIEAPLDDVYEIVSSPMAWVGVGGGSWHPGFSVVFSQDRSDPARQLTAEGTMLVEDVEDGEHVSFTWAWRVPTLPPDRELNLKERLEAVLNGAPFPDPPEVIDVRLRGDGSTTEVELTISGVPAEFAEATDAVWEWAMKRLARRATKQPVQMFPWGNYY